VTSPDSPNDPSNLVALSQFRARLARGQRARRSEEIFASDDPPATIRALPPDEFFYVIHELGFPDAMEILVHGTPEQIQAVLDFSVWDRDRVAMEPSDEWLAALVEAPVEALGKWAQGIDVELLALLIRKRCRIYDLSLEEVPEETEAALWNSPDRLFTLEFLGDQEQGRVTQHLVDSLYRYSPDLMRRLLVGMRSENDAEMEETAFRWRTGRMADLGFVDFQEALSAYQELDPTSVHIGSERAPSVRPQNEPVDDVHLRLPMVVTERLSGKTPFARAVAGLQTREEAAELHYALVALCNRVLSADQVNPSDEEAIRGVLDRLSATLDLAIEFLARGDSEREVAAVRSIPILTLHRLGTSLIGKLRRLADALRRKNPFAVLAPALDIFETEDGEILASLTRTRPLFPRLLDQPPAAGLRPFATLADLARATRAVERAAAAIELLAGLGIRPAQVSPEALHLLVETAPADAPKKELDPAAIDAGVLARSVLVARLLGHPAAGLAMLSPASLEKFKQSFNAGENLPEKAGLQATEILQKASGSARKGGVHGEVAQRWIESLFPLASVLGYDKP
jgi:hypothetical protein